MKKKKKPQKAVDSEDGKYSYDSLISKDDLTVVELGETVPTKPDGTLDRAAILAAARKNAREQNNESNTEKETFVYVNDISLDVRVNREGLEHGLSRNAFDTALATMRIGDLLKSSIAVNELNGRTTSNKTTEMSYVLLAGRAKQKKPVSCQNGR